MESEHACYVHACTRVRATVSHAGSRGYCVHGMLFQLMMAWHGTHICAMCAKFGSAVKHEVVFMANDDAETPKALVGKKVAPILVNPDKTMGESMDIIKVCAINGKWGIFRKQPYL